MPQSMKMGTIALPFLYDVGLRHLLQPGETATACDIALRHEGGCLPGSAFGSGVMRSAGL